MSDARIHILPEFIANQIAAGEVVQRPDSVVKELVENSIDAGATHVTVVVRQAGKNSIHVIDDGSGMSKDDLSLALKRHATSKIRTPEDLERIRTLGFRGEALASISSVAHVEIRTRHAEDDHGWMLEAEPFREDKVTPVHQERGTQIIVRNLFYNIPARRKFLRSDVTEFRHISDTMTRFALSYPDRRFTFHDGDSLIFDLHPQSPEQRIEELFGGNTRNSVVPVELQTELVRVSGFIGKPHVARTTRAQQYLFLNRRTISSKSLSHAVAQGFEHLIEKTQYPMYVLNIEVDPSKIDVNVHPQKTEVKFDNERAMYDIVHEAVMRALRESNLIPEARFRLDESQNPFERITLGPTSTMPSDTLLVNTTTGEIIDSRVHDTPGGSLSAPAAPGSSGYGAMRSTERRQREAGMLSAYDALFYSAEAMNDQALMDSMPEAHVPVSHLWQLHDKYIFMQTPEGVVVIDQHIAHERILYEKACKVLNEGIPNSQRLLFAVAVDLTLPERIVVNEVHDDLQRLGFDMQNTATGVVLSAVPPEVKSGHEAAAFREIVEQYSEYSQVRAAGARDNLAASFACRSSIKAGDPLRAPEMRALVEDLFQTQTPEVCPHGRPVLIRFDLKEFDRRFGRTS